MTSRSNALSRGLFVTAFLSVVLTIFSAKMVFAADISCIGHDYEQQMQAGDLLRPFVEIISSSDSIEQGKTISLTANEKIDKSGKPFFYWCASEGEFEYDSTLVSDFKTVKYIAPSVASDKRIEITVQMGDSLGYIAFDTFYLNVNIFSQFVETIGNRQDGTVRIVNIDETGQTSGLGSTGTVKLNGTPVAATWNSDGIIVNGIWSAAGIAWDDFTSPIHVEIFDETGKIIGKTYYPFNDIGIQNWYTRSVMKLWKEGVLSGYAGTKSNAFLPNQNASRAEYLHTALTSDEKANSPGRIYPPYQNAFTDVTGTDWFAPYVQYAKTNGIVQGCDPANALFCPNDSINRAEAVAITTRSFDKLKTAFNAFVPPATSQFSDVTDSSEWYYPYVYTLRDKQIVDGYSSGTFKPGNPVNRAEMAKINCIAAFGVEECTFMGEMDTPFASSVTPGTATLNKPTVFTVKGFKLPDTTAFFIEECADLESLGGTAEQRQFRCTPSYTDGIKNGVVKDKSGGTELYKFTVKVLPEVVPSVISVSPLTATYEVSTVFTVQGENLPDTTAFWLANCANIENLGGTSSERQFRCTPSYETGMQNGEVKDKPDGNILKNFSVNVQSGNIPNTPVVTSVSPLTVTFEQLTIFTVTGSNLPDTTAYWIDECDGLVDLGGTSEQRQFQCTPSHSAGIKDGVVKDMAGETGNILKEFTVNVQEGYIPPPPAGDPKVFSVEPDEATLGIKTTFTVTGENLPDTTAFFIGECIDPTPLSGGTSEIRKFTCTPGYKIGSHAGEIKDKPQGTLLHDFSVNFLFGTPKVDTVTPTTVTSGEPTVFTVEGSSLPDTTVIWIDGCTGLVSFDGDANKRTFQCTPGDTGTKDGVVKDKPSGTVLKTFTVNVQ